MTVHIMRNIAACASGDCWPMLIHAIDIDQPPGIGIDDDMVFAVEMVNIQAATVKIAAVKTSNLCTRCGLLHLVISNRLIENFDEVHDAHRSACGLEARSDLEETSGIARDDHVCVGLENILHFPIAQLCRRLRLEQIVDTRRSAANIRFRDFAHGHTGDRLQQTSRLRADTLRMLQMAGVVIGGLELDGTSRRARLEVCEHF